jgi:K+-transporting ATPase ATPase A chain
MPTDNGLFIGLLIGVVLIVGELVYFPALTLAPVLEQASIGAVR